MMTKRVEEIKRWLETGMSEISEIDVNYLTELVETQQNEIKEAQELIKTLYNFLGCSADSDHRLWMKTKEYCFKKNLVEYKK